MRKKNQSQVKQIIKLITKAIEIGNSLGYPNILQVGFIKELIIADKLGHEVHKTKHDADATLNNKKYEYLTCFEGGSFQIDRLFKSPDYKKEKSLTRITRNDLFYCVVFSKNRPLEIISIYEVPTNVILSEVLRQLDISSNEIAHVSVPIKFVSSYLICRN